MTAILDISASDYHADAIDDQPTLSASIAKILCNATPAHAKAAHPRLNPDLKKKEEEKFDVGTASHLILLEGVSKIEVIVANDWKKQATRDLRDEARAAGRIPLLAKQAGEVYEMVEAIRAQLGALDVDPPLFEDGQPERTLVWEDQGVLCRARVDWLRDDLVALDDLKTTRASAEGKAWERTLYGMGADVQVAWYIRGVKAVCGVEPDFRFCVVEAQPPFALSVVGLAASALAVAQDKVDHALRLWKGCVESGVWPGYDKSIHRVEVPAWEEARWIEKTWVEAA